MKGSRQGRGLLAFYLARDPFFYGVSGFAGHTVESKGEKF